MGTPEFAVPTLKALVENGYQLVGVITAPDKPAGRGRKLQESAVKRYAVEQNLKVLQPTNLKQPEFVDELRSLNADLQIIVAFRMLPEVVWNMPPLGSVNLHASLLPDYRGAAPINRAVMNGETQSGLTTFFLQHAIDTGNLLFQEEMPIGENDTAGDLHDRMMLAGADLVLKTVRAIEAGDYQEQPQNEADFKNKAPKIFQEDCLINWNLPSDQVYNLIRGLSPYPGAFTFLSGKKLKIFSARKTKISSGEPGSTKIENGFLVSCSDRFLELTTIQLEGKKRMQATDFLRGNQLDKELILG